jgi:hypothetical protein
MLLLCPNLASDRCGTGHPRTDEPDPSADPRRAKATLADPTRGCVPACRSLHGRLQAGCLARLPEDATTLSRATKTLTWVEFVQIMTSLRRHEMMGRGAFCRFCPGWRAGPAGAVLMHP